MNTNDCARCGQADFEHYFIDMNPCRRYIRPGSLRERLWKLLGGRK